MASRSSGSAGMADDHSQDERQDDQVHELLPGGKPIQHRGGGSGQGHDTRRALAQEEIHHLPSSARTAPLSAPAGIGRSGLRLGGGGKTAPRGGGLVRSGSGVSRVVRSCIRAGPALGLGRARIVLVRAGVRCAAAGPGSCVRGPIDRARNAERSRGARVRACARREDACRVRAPWRYLVDGIESLGRCHESAAESRAALTGR